MTKDFNKQIENITYNHLNLPETIEITANNQSNYIYYTYDAAGIKLRKTAGSTSTDYVGNFVYEDGFLKYILTDYGTGFKREFNITDHLGNVRVTFNENGTVQQEDSYYPFGLTMNGLNYLSGSKSYEKNKYLYNGKELQEDYGLDWYDYGARFYDAQLGRWHVPDPMSEKRSWLSPYQYAQNNPINKIDPDGMLDDWVKNKETNEYEWRDDVTSEENTPEGYKYIGESGSDILSDMDISENYESKEGNRVSVGLDEDSGGVAIIGSEARTEGNISVSADISYNIDEGTENNELGRKFEGINVVGYFSQHSSSGNPDLQMEYKGHFETSIGNESVSYNLKTPSYSTVSPTIASGVKIPNSILKSNKPINVSIKAGTVNTGLLFQPKLIVMTWKIK